MIVRNCIDECCKDNRIRNIIFETKIISFCIVFVAMGLFLANIDIVPPGGDAFDIWQSITTWKTENVYRSYVLYKGFFSLHPYVELRELSIVCGLNEFFFIKAMHAGMFAYVTTIGLPLICQRLCEVEYKRSILVTIIYAGVCFYFWKRSLALTQLLIDIPSIFLLTLSLHFCLRVYDSNSRNNERVYILLNAIMVTVASAILSSLSGQYIISVGIIMISLLVILIKRKQFSAVFINGVIYAMITLFTKIWYVINVAPYNINNGKFWLERGLLYMLDIARFSGSSSLQSKRGFAVCVDLFGDVDTANTMLQLAELGGKSMTVKQYVLLVFHHPIDFLAMYIERLFLLLSYDNGVVEIDFIIQYAFLAISAAIISKLILNKKWYDIRIAIIASIFASVVPVLVLTVEMRYGMMLQGLIWGVALFSIEGRIRETIKNKSSICISKKETIYCIVFISICLAYMCEIYAQGQADVSLLH